MRLAAAGVLVLGILYGCGSSARDDGTPSAGTGGSTAGAGSGGGGGGGTAGDATGGSMRGGSAGSGQSGGTGGEGGGTGGSAGSSGGAAAGGTAGDASGGSAGVSMGSSCPSAMPPVGSSCGPDPRECSYGDSPFPECREHRVCREGQWAQGVSRGACRQAPPGVCPQSLSSQTACRSEDLGARCAYDGTLCTCVSEICGGAGCTELPSPQWFCYTVAAGCPSLAPNLGAACVGDYPFCEYEYCGLLARCVDGTWAWLFGCA
jgi:hypothetical protein